MTILQELCSVPTAPFAEQRVVEYVQRFVRSRRNLKLSRDPHGNLLIELRSSNRGAPRWVFGAHMDHPGFVATRMLDGNTLEARFHGWVKSEFFKGERVRFFDVGKREIRGSILDFTIGKERGVPNRVRLRVARPVAPDSPGMWD